MAYTSADLDALDQAILKSELEVELADRRVRYRSMDELLKARAHVAGLLAAAARPTGVFRPAFTTQRE